MNKYKNILYFIIYLTINPRLIWLSIFNRLYIPVFVQYEWLKKYKINTIVDVGAHTGRVSKVINFLFPKAHIFAFEPNKDLHRSIKSKIDNSKLTLENLALSEKKGSSSFYIYSDSTLSSMMNLITPGFRRGIKINYKKITVPVTTLDNYFSNMKLHGNIFLKIDTEGAEGLVLKGGGKFLNKVSVIHIETYFNKLYKKQLLFADIYDLLIKKGFVYAGEANEANFYPIFGPIDISNSVFVKRELFHGV